MVSNTPDSHVPNSALSLAWDRSSNPFLLLDRAGWIQAYNPAASALLGPLDSTTSFSQLLSEQAAFLPLLQQCLTQKHPVSAGTVRFRSPSQGEMIVQMEFHPLGESGLACLTPVTPPLEHLEEAVRRNDARIEKLSVQLRQVSSELLQKTMELAEEKKRLTTVINGIREGLLGCDAQGRLIHYNETARNLLNFSAEEVKTQTFPNLCPAVATAVGFHPGDLSNLVPHRMDITLNHKIIHIIASPISDENKQPIGLVLILHDRTQEAELDQMKDDLISIVSHELRSPLTSIKGYMDLMLGGELGEIPASIQGYLTIVSSNANRLAALIDDMLDLSRIESGKLSMSFGKIEIKYLCDYVYLTMKPLATQKTIEFTQEVQADLAVSGDVDRLQQALTNLVSNAIKYTPEHGRVTIQAFRKDHSICIAVQDSGIGIGEMDQKKLFHKFFRVKNNHTRHIGGTGLGLCITKSIVEAHEGHIHLESKEGEGSCFTMELPDFRP
ncbi:MAG: ATP-binding protein [bacterium]|nr:ATP-binding protein [bacterium]